MSGLEFETTTHSELLACVEFPLQLPTIELEVWDALFGGLSNELLTSQAKQLGVLSTRDFSLPIELENDQLARRLFHGAVQTFKQIDEVLIELDLDRSHGINLDSYSTPEPVWTEQEVARVATADHVVWFKAACREQPAPAHPA